MQQAQKKYPDKCLKILTKNWRYVGAMVELGRIEKKIWSLDLSRTCEEIGGDFLQQLAGLTID
jgi:hypothetical protein